MTDTDTRYNGWTNRATWAVNLHLTNDETLLSRAGDYARDSKGCDSSFSFFIEGMLANWDHIVDDCEEFVDVNWPEILKTTFAPILEQETTR